MGGRRENHVTGRAFYVDTGVFVAESGVARPYGDSSWKRKPSMFARTGSERSRRRRKRSKFLLESRETIEPVVTLVDVDNECADCARLAGDARRRSAIREPIIDLVGVASRAVETVRCVARVRLLPDDREDRNAALRIS